ncbi:MAG: helix-turn-helix domain-containing protein, partial [Gammaproteobacteria bacterium]|nr:helix-turn-helix domain-containing protein [Gammaproteobacteria bacterium]
LAGMRIRAIRAERNMTQQHLADLADISRATLATIEKDDANPSLAVVYRIAVALECSLDELVVENHQRVQVFRGDEMRQVETGDKAYLATVVSPANTNHFLQQIFRLRADSSFTGKPHPPGSEEYLHILEGEIIIEAAGEKAHIKQGDSAHFGGNVHHRYINPTPKDATGLVTILEKEAKT